MFRLIASIIVLLCIAVAFVLRPSSEGESIASVQENQQSQQVVPANPPAGQPGNKSFNF